jgi:hypothetical protein
MKLLVIDETTSISFLNLKHSTNDSSRHCLFLSFPSLPHRALGVTAVRFGEQAKTFGG